MSYFAAISSCFRHYVSFSGRAPRSEYWYWHLTIILFNILLGAGPLLAGRATFSETVTRLPLLALFWLVTLLPNFSVLVRRLHDVNKSGFWWFGTFIPFINFYVLFLLFFKRGSRGPNKFGDDPNGGGASPDQIIQMGTSKSPPRTRFSDEEFAYAHPQGRTRPKAANDRPRARVPIILGKQARGFGRRGAGNHEGFRRN